MSPPCEGSVTAPGAFSGVRLAFFLTFTKWYSEPRWFLKGEAAPPQVFPPSFLLFAASLFRDFPARVFSFWDFFGRAQVSERASVVRLKGVLVVRASRPPFFRPLSPFES